VGNLEALAATDCGSDTGLSSAEAGLDLSMPDSVYWGVSGGNLAAAVNNGSLAESRVTDMATRIIGAWYQMGQDVSSSNISKQV
jgi:beta-glucosidase